MGLMYVLHAKRSPSLTQCCLLHCHHCHCRRCRRRSSFVVTVRSFLRSFVRSFVRSFLRLFVCSFLHSFLSLLLLRSFVLSFLRSPFNALTVTVVLRVTFVHFAVRALPLCCLLFVVHSFVCSVLVLLVIRCRVVDVAVRCGVVTVFAEDTRGMGLVWLCGA